MTSYFSIIFLAIFLPLVILIYMVLPSKIRPYFLLLASLIFYYLVSGYLIAYIILTSIFVYLASLLITKLGGKRFLIFTILVILSVILLLKYSPFIILNLNSLMDKLGNPLNLTVPKFILPLGISFYSLQAISYLVDLSRKNYKMERNPLKLLLYLSFFPTVVEGPIVRYNDVKDDYFSGKAITYLNFKNGLIRIAYGLLKKIVIADRLNLFVKNVFTDYNDYAGSLILLASIFYTIELYAEFSGTMDLVIGTSEIFGIKLKENFNNPFFSKSIKEFWQRWHISLGSFFKDYVFYPINLSKPVKSLRKKSKKYLGLKYSIILTTGVSLLVVWVLNGLWHGSGYNYLFFGLYHFFLIYLASIVEPYTSKFKFNKTKYYDYFRIVRTSLLVVIGELFFRASSLTSGLVMFKKIFTEFDVARLSKVTSLGLDMQDILIVLVSLVIIFIISLAKEKGLDVRKTIETKPLVIRWSIYYLLIFYIIIFGAYGYGYLPVDPIYANF